jgi:MOSC domain-containing protein YiiM
MTQPNLKAEGRSGRIFQINVSNGGVPKLACAQTRVTELGLEGDHQQSTDIHGGPDRAVSLYSLDCILALQEEGHPIFPGAAGENLTISGLDWNLVTPGARLRLGSEVEVEVTRYTSPCENIAYAFMDEKFTRISQKVHPGWSRVYARVVQPGWIRVGEPVSLQTSLTG